MVFEKGENDMVEVNPNYRTKCWKVILYKNDILENERRILTIIGTMIDVFIKIKSVMDCEDYNYITIEEVKKCTNY